MKKIKFALLCVISLLIADNKLYSQNNFFKKPYKIWVTKMDGTKADRGILTAFGEEYVEIESLSLNKSKKIDVHQIKNLRLVRKGKLGRGLGIGFIAGFATGFIIGIASDDDPPGLFSYTSEEKAVAGGVFLGLSGAAVGGIFSLFKAKIPIDGSFNNYKEQRSRLNQF